MTDLRQLEKGGFLWPNVRTNIRHISTTADLITLESVIRINREGKWWLVGFHREYGYDPKSVDLPQMVANLLNDLAQMYVVQMLWVISDLVPYDGRPPLNVLSADQENSEEDRMKEVMSPNLKG